MSAKTQEYIFIRFYEELNDFLPRKHRKVEFRQPLSGKISVKELIESLGVPHTEVDLILVNKNSVDFSYCVQPEDRISVYPVFESFDISPIIRLRPTPLRQTRFVLDVHLGKLAVYLRFAGYDTLYRNNYHDDELAETSVKERRILLTRDRQLLQRRMITHGYYVRRMQLRQQLNEVSQRFQLSFSSLRSQRCTRCNSQIRPIEKEQIASRLAPKTREYYQEFFCCPHCDKIYWKGSHYQRMLTVLQSIGTQI